MATATTGTAAAPRRLTARLNIACYLAMGDPAVLGRIGCGLRYHITHSQLMSWIQPRANPFHVQLKLSCADINSKLRSIKTIPGRDSDPINLAEAKESDTEKVFKGI